MLKTCIFGCLITNRDCRNCEFLENFAASGGDRCTGFTRYSYKVTGMLNLCQHFFTMFNAEWKKKIHSDKRQSVRMTGIQCKMQNAQCTISLHCALCTVHCALQDEFPIPNIDPTVKLAANLAKVCNLFEAKFFMQFDAGLVRK